MSSIEQATAPVSEKTVELRRVKAVPLTPEAFSPFGQVVGSFDDGKVYDNKDAQLLGFDSGTPRFYIMRLPERGLKFHRITFHRKVTQCLGVLAPMAPWFMCVARPTAGVEDYPRQEDFTVFKIPHGVYVKMHQGTWHAGPLFSGHAHMDFYNLELSDTNVTDHNTHDYKKKSGLEFEVVNEEA